MATADTLAPERLLTIDEYLALPATDQPTELVRGRIVVVNPANPWHGYVCSRVVFLLNQFVEERKCGSVASNDSGVITERDPDSLRGADVSYYSFERLPMEAIKQWGYPSVAPDLVFEVKSRYDRWTNILAKVAEYLNAGVRAVCVLDPERMTAAVYRDDLPAETLTAEQTLTLPGVLPGFAVQVRRFFEA